MRRLAVSLRWLAAYAASGLLLLTVAIPAAAATAPALVKDINPTGSANPSHLTRVGNLLYFAADDGVHGVELWKSDGTTAGTTMVKNIRPYEKGSSPQDLVEVNGTLYFTAVDGVHGREIWKSDGTRAGTVMVKDINTNAKSSYCGNGISMPYAPVAVGSRLFFVLHCGGVWSGVLWVSDGTASGTHQLLNAPYVANHAWGDEQGLVLGALGGRLYFVAGGSDGGEDYTQLWSSDGTDAGTQPVPGAPTPQDMSILPATGTYLYFTQTSLLGLPPEPMSFVWRTDGTALGTKRLTGTADLDTTPQEAAYLANRLFFDGGGLWKTNGTASGTKVISDGELDWLTTAGPRLFFTRAAHLWKSDGTGTGTRDMGTFGPNWPNMLVAVGAKVCFAEFDYEAQTWTLWQSDGTKTGTYAVKSFTHTFDWSDGVPLGVAIGSRLLFAADDGSHGSELWSYAP